MKNGSSMRQGEKMDTQPMHSNSGSHARGMILIHTAVFLFGFAGLFGKFLDCSPFYIVFGRTVFAAMALFAYARGVLKITLSGFGKRDIIFFILQGILLGSHWVLFFLSIQVSSVAVGLVTFSSFPLFVTFMEPLFFKERLQAVDVATALAVFAGIILVVPDINFSNQVTLGAVYGILSGLTFAILALVNRRNVTGTHAVAVAFYQNFFAALFLGVPLIALKPDLPGMSALPLLIALGVIFTAFAHTCFISSLAVIRVQTASVIAGLEPVYGIVFAFLLLNETPDIRVLGGGIIIIGTTVVAGVISRSKNN